MSDWENRVYNKLEQVLVTQERHQVTLETNTAALIEHMRRTSLLEEQLKPVQRHVYWVEGALKMLGLMGVAVTVANGAIKILEHLSLK